MLKVVKVRLYPNKVQQQLIHKTFGSCRYVYNMLLDAKIKAYECGDNLSAYELKKRLVPMKNVEGGEFLKEVDSTALQNAVLKIDVAYKNFFRRVKQGGAVGFPRFKSKHNSYQSYQSSTATIKNNKLKLPKIGEVKTKFHRGVITSKVKTVTVSCEANQYFASINYEDGLDEVVGINNGKTIAIDVGVKIFAQISNDKKITIDEEHNLSKDIKKMIKAQKSLSLKKKGSNNRAKAKLKLAKAHLKIRNKRDDFLHKISNQLSENQTIKVEDLKIKNMSKKAKGTLTNPNMRASAKAGLNRSILQQSWGKFFEMLEYKLKRNGGELIKVNPQYTSQKCSSCGHISQENRKVQAKFKCIQCGFEANADYNASLNILNSDGVGTTLKAS
ncbi:MAG: transposase [Campylobacterales bacterium]